jgi:phospholipase C
VLGSAAGITGAAVASMALPPNVRKALAAEPNRPGSFRDIKHVVMLMQEDRSFDHYFGTMAGVAGLNDPQAIKQANGRSIFYQPDSVNPDGYLLPFHLDTLSTNAQAIPSTSHAFDVQHSALSGGMSR